MLHPYPSLQPFIPMMVSIVLPTYNGSRYVASAIQSVLDQTYPHWELIVVDDCSTDHTPEIIAGFAAGDPRIRSIRHETNRKLPAALNTGFAEAKGGYLTWTSDDNLYKDDALEEMVGFLESNPDSDIVYADQTVIDDEGREAGKWIVGEPEQIVYTNCINACFLYRRAVHEALGGYSEDLFLIEDWDFFQRAAARFTLRPLHKDLYLFRKHAGSLSNQRKDQIGAVWKQMLDRNLPRIPWTSRAQRALAYIYLANHALESGDRVMTRQAVFAALRHSTLQVLRSGKRALAAAIFRG